MRECCTLVCSPMPVFLLYLATALLSIFSNPPRLSAASALGKSQAFLSTHLIWLGWYHAHNQPGLSLPTWFRTLEDLLGPAAMYTRVWVWFGICRGFFVCLFFAGTDCRAEAAPAAVSSCLGCAEQPVSCSSAEPLNLSHHSLEGSCRADDICSFPTTLSAPVDGRIAGKYDFIAWFLGLCFVPSAHLSPFHLLPALVCASLPQFSHLKNCSSC